MTATPPQAGMFDPQVETLPRAALADLQLDRLRRTLAHVYANVPHTRRAFEAHGVGPDDLRSLDDLRRFPFSVKADLRDTYPYGLFAVPRTQVVRIHASSGTTGKPTVVGYTAGDIDRWSDMMARAMATAGTRPGEVVHNAYGYGLFTGGMGFHYGAERLGCTVVPISGGNTERQIAMMLDLEASILCSTPSYALNLAEAAERMGVDLRDSPLRIGLFGGEPWSDGLRREIDARLGIQSTDSYGLSEIIGPGVAMECPHRCGLHGWEDHFLFEVIDPETLEPLPMGSTGELVITTLTKEALPMIRYRTRDITRLSDDPCACGRTHVRIMRVTGRNDDMIIIRGVNVYPSQIEAVMLGFPGTAPHYLLTVERQGSLDTLDVQVEAAPDVAANAYPAMADRVRRHIKSIVGVTCGVSILAPGTLPRSEGKATRVRDLRR
ncbi:phenylacetate--CoA ligase family protein [Rhodospira trueperi]|uniref:Phenylacetate-coenzyme A ligase n=1 Tax=Rhodospira trueperi TaxID=69960 RepID=A0A1G6WU26_9PROT|nr:phenylacetate--CoA ligase [Rhodospira trueperi]SDD68697.1 phenylacetate-CoA ligase [Rhodospira trueperi]